MTVTPQITADFEEYPELRTLMSMALRRVAELMEIHDIASLRRIRKTGVFAHPYEKDVITPLGSNTVPNTIAAARYATGKALLDYLESIGVSGIDLGLTQEEAASVAAVWAPPAREPQRAPDPHPAPEPEPEPEEPKDNASGDTPQEPQPTKETSNGQQATD